MNKVSVSSNAQSTGSQSVKVIIDFHWLTRSSHSLGLTILFEFDVPHSSPRTYYTVLFVTTNSVNASFHFYYISPILQKYCSVGHL